MSIFNFNEMFDPFSDTPDRTKKMKKPCFRDIQEEEKLN